MANVIKTLSSEHEVSLIYPGGKEQSIPGFVKNALRIEKQGSRRNIYSPKPKLGSDLLEASERIIERFLAQENPDFVYWSHSYLPAAIPKIFEKYLDRNVVEFANIEAKRFWSTSKTAKSKMKIKLALEALKARFWEPRVARQAALCVALSEQDGVELKRLGARVVEAANGVAFMPLDSVADGYLLIFASMNYQPNFEATMNFVNHDWPVISHYLPELKLVIAGRSAENLPLAASTHIEVISDPQSQDEIYRGALATVIPTATGGGSQLKITESLQRGRICLLSEYSLKTAPSELINFLVPYVFTSPQQLNTLIQFLQTPEATRNLEHEISAAVSKLSWQETLGKLLQELRIGPNENL